MPKEADIALHRWFQGKTHQNLADWIEPAERESLLKLWLLKPQELADLREELEQS